MGASVQVCNMPSANIATQISNMEAANGRILDVDIAAETTNLAKQQILVQASASMVAQANTANKSHSLLLGKQKMNLVQFKIFKERITWLLTPNAASECMTHSIKN